MDWLSELLDAAASAGHPTGGPDGMTWIAIPLLLLLLAIPMGPAEPAAAAAGALAGAGGFPLWAAATVAASGMFTGNLLTFCAGGPLIRRISRTPKGAVRLARWRTALEARPLRRDAAVVGLRMVPGARTPAALAARGTGLSVVRFCLLDAAGSLLWAALWTGAGAAAHQVPSEVGGAFLILAAGGVVVLLHHRYHRRPARREVSTV